MGSSFAARPAGSDGRDHASVSPLLPCRDRRTRRYLGITFVFTVVLVAGCDRRQLGLPRVALEVVSPDGTSRAYVRNHMEIDPPSQSLWIRTPAGRKKVLRLGADSDWCNTIVWSGDGSRVGFLVQDARLVVADAASGEIVWDQWLVGDEPRSYPTREKVFALSLSEDGSQATFERCPRRGTGSCDVVEQVGLR